jgi:hypothetical protein
MGRRQTKGTSYRIKHIFEFFLCLSFTVRCGVGSTDQKINMQSPSELRQIRHSGQFDDDQV